MLALAVVFVWSTSWVLIKFGLEDLPPLTFAGIRYALAAGVLAAVFFSRGGSAEIARLPRQERLRLAVVGLLLYTLTQGAIFVALAWLPAITVNLLWGFSTIVVGVLGRRWLNESPRPVQWLGVALATAGAVVYFLPSGWPASRPVGLAAAAVGVLANASAAVLGRRINRSARVAPLAVTTLSMAAGALPLLAIGVWIEGPPTLTPTGLFIVIWLALVNTAVAFTLWNATLQTLTAVESSVINGTMLIWIPVLAVLFLGEHLGLVEVLGLVMAGAGTLLVQLNPRRLPPVGLPPSGAVT